MIRFRFEDPDGIKEKLASFPSRLRVGIVKALEDAVVQVQREARINAPVFRGALRSSIVFLVNDEGDRIKAEVGTGLVYGGVIEEGRSSWPGAQPPVDNLRAWAARRLGDETLAFVIARSIKRRGIRAQPFLRPAFQTVQPRISQFLETRLKQAFEL